MVYLLEGALLVEEEKFLKKKELRVMRTFLMEPEEGWEGYLMIIFLAPMTGKPLKIN
ncbi:MAG: hypothetical protein J7L45_00170 [Candidatus Aenigmarchaeota archaeon]|nr:hypothetical protein [Candidatus Aenigmarchaeota archaeon]